MRPGPLDREGPLDPPELEGPLAPELPPELPPLAPEFPLARAASKPTIAGAT
jgi:hypothetical protein